MFLFYSVGQVCFAFAVVLELKGREGVGQGGNVSRETHRVQLCPHVSGVAKLHFRGNLDIPHRGVLPGHLAVDSQHRDHAKHPVHFPPHVPLARNTYPIRPREPGGSRDGGKRCRKSSEEGKVFRSQPHDSEEPQDSGICCQLYGSTELRGAWACCRWYCQRLSCLLCQHAHTPTGDAPSTRTPGKAVTSHQNDRPHKAPQSD